MRFNNKPRRAVDPNIFRFGNALHSKPWIECCLLRCMLSAGREVKMEIPICACYFNKKRTLCRFGLISRSEARISSRSEEHTSELQSRRELVCRLLLEKK